MVYGDKKEKCIKIFIKNPNARAEDVARNVGCSIPTVNAARAEVVVELPGKGYRPDFVYTLKPEYLRQGKHSPTKNKVRLRVVPLDAAEEESLSSGSKSEAASRCIAGFVKLLQYGNATAEAIIDNVVSHLDPELIYSRLMLNTRITRKAK